MDLRKLLAPQSVAVIGASRTPGKVGHEVVANLVNGGFSGSIHPINPSADEVVGRPCLPSISAIGHPVDLAVVTVPPAAVKGAVTEALAKGVGALAVLTAGFKEVGKDGAALEAEIGELCRRRRVPLLGPNSLGLINAHLKMNATFANLMPTPGSISVISQSGALCVAILDWAASRGLGLGTLVSIGNKADLNEVDFLEALTKDEKTKVIAAYLESIEDGDDFLRAAREAAEVKPVVILKVGVTAAGARAASSHTGSLAGADMAYGAAFKRAGVIRAESFEALFDYATALAMQPLPRGKRVAVVTNAGGPGIMAADAGEALGLDLAPVPKDRREKLAPALPAEASLSNPVDVIGDADPQRYMAAVEALAGGDAYDALAILATPQNMTKPMELAEKLAGVRCGDKPMVTSFVGGAEVGPAKLRLTELGIPDYPSPERAMAALKAMHDYGAWLNRPPRVVSRFPANRRRVDRILRWHRRMELLQIAEVEAKDILRAYDFPIPEGQLVETADEAIAVADRIGYPVVLKVVSPDVIHKSDVGGVRLNLADREQVRDAFDLMILRIERKMPGATIRGAYIERMGQRGREVILGMTRDPLFGPMLMFGLGGIFVEVMKDVAFHLAPITADEALEMLLATRSYALLQGTRGQAPVDLDAIAGGLQRISQLATDYPEIQELDINPFIVGEVTGSSYVADARITLSTAEPKS